MKTANLAIVFTDIKGFTERTSRQTLNFTEAVYLAMNKAEMPSQEVGAFELKRIPGKIRVFRVPLAPYRVEPPPSVVHLTPGAESPVEQDPPPFGNPALSRVPGAK